MLILSRRSGEEIVVGSNILVRVLNIDKNRVRLGIAAPREVTVFRQEIIRNGDNQETAEVSPPIEIEPFPGEDRDSAPDIDLDQRVHNILINDGITSAQPLSVEAGLHRVVDHLKVGRSPVDIHGKT